MTNYTPQVGDLVRRTFPNGTTLQGTITECSGSGVDSWGNTLYNKFVPEETELIDRPFEFKNEVGTCYRHPAGHLFTVVKVVEDDLGGLNWLGYLPDRVGRWYFDSEVEEMVRDHGWIEHPLTSD